jgi:hypothetical protein
MLKRLTVIIGAVALALAGTASLTAASAATPPAQPCNINHLAGCAPSPDNVLSTAVNLGSLGNANGFGCTGIQYFTVTARNVSRTNAWYKIKFSDGNCDDSIFLTRPNGDADLITTQYQVMPNGTLSSNQIDFGVPGIPVDEDFSPSGGTFYFDVTGDLNDEQTTITVATIEF